jgi:hypothetical protein
VTATQSYSIITVRSLTDANMGNEALDINGMTNTVTTNNHITRRGSDWYFAVCAVMAVSSLVFMGLSFTKTRSQRIFRMCAPPRKAVAFHHVSFALLRYSFLTLGRLYHGCNHHGSRNRVLQYGLQPGLDGYPGRV